MDDQQLFIVAITVASITPILTFLTVLAGFVFNWLTSAEARRRDKEDRQEVVKQAKLATEAAAKAALLASRSLNVVHTAVVEVGEKADAAYKEANQSNLKIQSVQDALTKVLDLPQKAITETTGAHGQKAS